MLKSPYIMILKGSVADKVLFSLSFTTVVVVLLWNTRFLFSPKKTEKASMEKGYI